MVELPKHKDFRYIPNIISSAIVNTPPPDLMADVLNKRNKVHQFDEDTVEDMIPIFMHGVDGKPRNNKHLLPHRNWCAIRLYQPGDTPPSSRPPSMYDKSPLGSPPGSTRGPGSIVRRLTKRRGSSYRPDGPSPTVSRPPLSAGLDRMFSRSRRASTSSADQGPGIIKRTLSLTRADSLTGRRGLFGLRKGPGGSATNVQRPPSPHHDNRDGRVANNRDGYDDYDGYDDAVYDDYHDHPPRRSQGATAQASSGARDSGRMGLRGGAGSQEYVAGDDSHFTASRPPKNDRHYPPPAGVSRHQRSVSAGGSSTMTAGGNVGGKPLSRTPTGLSAKQIKRAGGDAAAFDVDVEGALEVTINVEVSPKDPAGITTPYRLVVPRLVYNYDLEEGAVWKKTKSHGGVKKLLGVGGGSTGGIKRWVSLRRGKSSTSQQEVGLDGEDGDDHHDHHGGEDYERADEQHRNQLDYDDDEEDYEHDARHRHHQGPAPGGGGVGSKAQNQHYLA